MRATTLSFRAPAEFAGQTKAMAQAANLSASNYMREAVREKNERMLAQRLHFLSQELSERHLVEIASMDAGTGDGLA